MRLVPLSVAPTLNVKVPARLVSIAPPDSTGTVVPGDRRLATVPMRDAMPEPVSLHEQLPCRSRAHDTRSRPLATAGRRRAHEWEPLGMLN